jgi:hypothetical protein
VQGSEASGRLSWCCLHLSDSWKLLSYTLLLIPAFKCGCSSSCCKYFQLFRDSGWEYTCGNETCCLSLTKLSCHRKKIRTNISQLGSQMYVKFDPTAKMWTSLACHCFQLNYLSKPHYHEQKLQKFILFPFLH